MAYTTQYGLPQNVVNYLNQQLPTADIYGGITSIPFTFDDVAAEQQIEAQAAGLTPEQLGLLYPQVSQVREGGGDEGFADNVDTTNNAGIYSLSDFFDKIPTPLNLVRKVIENIQSPYTNVFGILNEDTRKAIEKDNLKNLPDITDPGSITGDARVAEDTQNIGRQDMIDAMDRISGVTTGDASVAEAVAAANRAAQAAANREARRSGQYGGDNGGNNGNSGSNNSGGGYTGGGWCFDPNTSIQMADGSTKKIKNIQLGDNTKGGEVTGVFQFKAADEIHDYKGVIVAGSHFVKEDGKFIMVKDSPIAIKIDKIPVVYSLDTSGRRIFINDIEFADYNGDGIAKNFLNNAGVDLSGFDKEVLRQVENRLI